MSKLELGSLKIGLRLAFGFGPVLALLIVLVVTGWSTADSGGSTARQSPGNTHWATVRTQFPLTRPVTAGQT